MNTTSFKGVSRLKTLAAVAALASAGAFGMAGVADASTVQLDKAPPPKAVEDWGSVVCSVFCQGWDGNEWGGIAQGIPAPGGEQPNEANIAGAFNETGDIGGNQFSADDADKVDGPSVNAFNVDAPYFWVFDANNLYLFRTEDAGPQTFTFNKDGGGAPSNVGAMDGSIAPIPLPAAAWMLLTAIGGLGVVGVRRRRQTAA